MKKKRNMKNTTTVTCLLFCASLATGYAQMQTDAIGGNPNGMIASGGAASIWTNSWTNPTGKDIFIWGVEIDLWNGNFPIDNNSLDSFAGAGATYIQNLQSVADMGATVSIKGNPHGLIRSKGSDHYKADPSLNANEPKFFPVPFIVPPGGVVLLWAFCRDGYQAVYGGEMSWNAAAFLYYTIQTPQGQ